MTRVEPDHAAVMAATAAQIRGYLSAFGLKREDVDDVAQEVYLAWCRDGHRKPADVATIQWLKGIARHRALDRLRATRSGALRAAIADLVATAPAPEPEDDDLEALRSCLERLPEPERRLIVRHHVDGVASGRLASDTGRSGAAIRRELARLREVLLRCIQRQRATP